MLDLLYHIFNYTIAGCYFCIFGLIFSGLIKEKAFGRNALGTATSGIFLTCGAGHLTHSLTSHVYDSLVGAGFQVIIDGWTVVPAVTYLILRHKYGLIVRGPDMIHEFKLQVAEQANQIKVMREFEKLKDDFLAMASHELRTPLTAIKGYAQILTREMNKSANEKALHAVEVINRQTDNMTNLIQMLLDVTRIQAGKIEMHPQSLNLNTFITNLVNQLQATTPRQLNLQLDNYEAWVEADPERLEQVFNNLVGNAIKYSPSPQKIDVIVGGDSQKGVLLQVRDYGRGIAPDELPQIFERFYRAPSVINTDKQGLGLGLYICREIIRGSGGTISVTSTPSVGSTFTVQLPSVAKPLEKTIILELSPNQMLKTSIEG